MRKLRMFAVALFLSCACVSAFAQDEDSNYYVLWSLIDNQEYQSAFDKMHSLPSIDPFGGSSMVDDFRQFLAEQTGLPAEGWKYFQGKYEDLVGNPEQGPGLNQIPSPAWCLRGYGISFINDEYGVPDPPANFTVEIPPAVPTVGLIVVRDSTITVNFTKPISEGEFDPSLWVSTETGLQIIKNLRLNINNYPIYLNKVGELEAFRNYFANDEGYGYLPDQYQSDEVWQAFVNYERCKYRRNGVAAWLSHRGVTRLNFIDFLSNNGSLDYFQEAAAWGKGIDPQMWIDNPNSDLIWFSVLDLIPDWVTGRDEGMAFFASHPPTGLGWHAENGRIILQTKQSVTYKASSVSPFSGYPGELTTDTLFHNSDDGSLDYQVQIDVVSASEYFTLGKSVAPVDMNKWPPRSGPQIQIWIPPCLGYPIPTVTAPGKTYLFIPYGGGYTLPVLSPTLKSPFSRSVLSVGVLNGGSGGSSVRVWPHNTPGPDVVPPSTHPNDACWNGHDFSTSWQESPTDFRPELKTGFLSMTNELKGEIGLKFGANVSDKLTVGSQFDIIANPARFKRWRHTSHYKCFPTKGGGHHMVWTTTYCETQLGAGIIPCTFTPWLDWAISKTHRPNWWPTPPLHTTVASAY